MISTTVCIDSSARRPNHTLYTDETTSLSTLRWKMSAPVVTFGTTLKTVFLLETSPNQTQCLATSAVVDFSSVAPVNKNRPRCEHSSSEIATFGHDPGSDAETGPEEVREVFQTAPKSS